MGLAIFLVGLFIAIGALFYLPSTQPATHANDMYVKNLFSTAPNPTSTPLSWAVPPVPIPPAPPVYSAADASINELEAALAAQLKTNNELKAQQASLQRRVDDLGAL